MPPADPAPVTAARPRLGTGPDAPATEALLRRALLVARPPSSDFDLDPGLPRPEGRTLRPAAVLLAVDDEGRDLDPVKPTRAVVQRRGHQLGLVGGLVEVVGEPAANVLGSLVVGLLAAALGWWLGALAGV